MPGLLRGMGRIQREGIVAKYWINESDNSLNKDERTKISYKWYFSCHLHDLQGMEDMCWGVVFLFFQLH